MHGWGWFCGEGDNRTTQMMMTMPTTNAKSITLTERCVGVQFQNDAEAMERRVEELEQQLGTRLSPPSCLPYLLFFRFTALKFLACLYPALLTGKGLREGLCSVSPSVFRC